MNNLKVDNQKKVFAGMGRSYYFVMPVPDQVRDDGSGIPCFLDSGFRRNDAVEFMYLIISMY